MRRRIVIGCVLIFLPVLLGNKGCGRSTTWGKKYFTKWQEDHVDIDKDTKCIDCHDDIKTPKVKPKNHDLTWKHEHGNYMQQKYGYRGENVCYLCHTEATCTSCHQQEAPINHTEYWKLKGHAAMVGLNRSQCMACHTTSDFCERCHSTTKPLNHSAAWGRSANQHCYNCHYPLTSAGGEKCQACHAGTPSHDLTPQPPRNALHMNPGVDCRSSGCHMPLRHPDNGMSCTACHRL